MNAELIKLAKRIFDFACQNALNNKVYNRFVDGWREKSNYLIYDIADIIKNAYLDGQTHEFMNMRIWRSWREPVVCVKCQGSKQILKIAFTEEIKIAE